MNPNITHAHISIFTVLIQKQCLVHLKNLAKGKTLDLTSTIYNAFYKYIPYYTTRPSQTMSSQNQCYATNPKSTMHPSVGNGQEGNRPVTRLFSLVVLPTRIIQLWQKHAEDFQNYIRRGFQGNVLRPLREFHTHTFPQNNSYVSLHQDANQNRPSLWRRGPAQAELAQPMEKGPSPRRTSQAYGEGAQPKQNGPSLNIHMQHSLV